MVPAAKRSCPEELINSHLTAGASVSLVKSGLRTAGTTPGDCQKAAGQNHLAPRVVVSINPQPEVAFNTSSSFLARLQSRLPPKCQSLRRLFFLKRQTWIRHGLKLAVPSNAPWLLSPRWRHTLKNSFRNKGIST